MTSGNFSTVYKERSTVQFTGVPGDCTAYMFSRNRLRLDLQNFQDKQSSKRKFQGQGTAQCAGFLETGVQRAQWNLQGQGVAKYRAQ